ncbi:killer cell lectin-like receptor subfamily G member 1 isoform X4 [Grus americana]|uniref:killer cell lectin-like receptor subfamily G member 1 isoform X4 n=1 Tax=Grus americana TaxID=9117 RepID=UPI002407A986|nr:killer cell lectin-like receptor subfamily G member 1 isoform X4 [Grus americana]
MAEAVPDAGEDVTAVMMSSQQRTEEGTSFSLKCIKDKKVPIAVTVVIAALLLTIIALAAKKCPSCPSCPSPVLSCLGEEIGYGDKCFYFVEAEADWNRSQIFCLSLGAHLATIDSRGDLVNEKSLRNWISSCAMRLTGTSGLVCKGKTLDLGNGSMGLSSTTCLKSGATDNVPMSTWKGSAATGAPR